MNNISNTFVLISTALISVLLFTAISSAQDTAPPAESGTGAADSAEYLKTVVLEPGASCISVSCHADMEKKKYLHAIGVDGMKCNRCHEIMNETKHEFRKTPEITVSLCAECHRADVIPPKGLIKSPPRVISEDNARKLHKPFAEGKCTACHDAHSSDYYKHLKFPFPEGIYAGYKAGAYGLCLSCHKDMDEMLGEPRTLSLTMFRNGNRNLHFRHVNKAKGRSCKVCHNPHGLHKEKLLKDTFQFGKRNLTIDFEKTDEGGKCSTTCHREAKYNRYKPEFNFIKSIPLPGEDATEEDLADSRKADLRRMEEKADQKVIEDDNKKLEEQ